MKSVRKQVSDAYSDSSPSNAERDLKFLASDTVSLHEAVDIMEEATPHGYNGFEPSNLFWIEDYFIGEVEILLARESSVCVYVFGNIKDSATEPTSDMGKKLRNNEFSELTPEEFKERMNRRREWAKEHDSDYQTVSNKLRKKLNNTNKKIYRLWWD